MLTLGDGAAGARGNLPAGGLKRPPAAAIARMSIRTNSDLAPKHVLLNVTEI